MQPKHWYALLLLLLVPVFLSAQTGKIRGKVVDETTKEPLIGANIVVEGTTMGAASDVNGEFIIINVAPGQYTMKASYVGYRTITVTGVFINSGLTSEQNFELPGEGVSVPTVQITAERPLINKNATSSIRISKQEDIEKLPSRGVNAVVALQPGLVASSTDGYYYIRGSRSDETGWQLEGAGVRDPFSGGNTISIIAEAVEEIQVMTGGFSAEFGGANAGLIRNQLRSGTESWRFGLQGETDRYAPLGKKSLGSYSAGYYSVVGTASGPVFSDKIRTFLSLENRQDLSGPPTWWSGFDYGNFATVPRYTAQHPTQPLRDTVRWAAKGSPFAGTTGKDMKWSFAGTTNVDFGTTQFRVGGTFWRQDFKNGYGWNATNLDPSLAQEGHNQNYFVDAKLTQFIGTRTFLEVSGSYYGTDYERYDPIFKDNFYLYGDSAANWNMRHVRLRADGSYPDLWGAALGDAAQNTGFMADIFPPNSGPSNDYYKDSRRTYGAKADFTTQFTNNVDFKAGGEYQKASYRRYTYAAGFNWLQNWAAFSKLYGKGTKRFEQALITNSNLTGYDYYGNETDGVTLTDTLGNQVKVATGPIKPVFADGYVQSKIELKDITLNVGLRYDYIYTDVLTLKNPGVVKFSSQYDVIMDANFTSPIGRSYWQPRFGFSFPVTDRTVFHAQYGKFVGQGTLGNEVNSPVALTNRLKGQYFYGTTYGFGLKPQQSTQYEFGFAQLLSDVASIDVTAFYKNIIDQVMYQYVLPQPGTDAKGPYPILWNGDFATTKGIEVKITLRRTSRLQANLNYTLSDSKATGSNANGNSAVYGGVVGGVPYIPKYIMSTTFNNPHRGNISLDYRFARNDGGPVLEQMGLNLLVVFRSGFSYTRLNNVWGDSRNITPAEEQGGSTGPWFLQFDGRLDKTVQFGPVAANFYIYVQNIPNSKMATTVNVRTGDPYNTGWLNSVQGIQTVSSYGKDAAKYAQIYDFFNQTAEGTTSPTVQLPRRIFFGVKLEY